jgi:predicted ATP-grasp superfamily ATP-dependent carboligase
MCVSRMGKVWFYKGVHKVKVVTESEGYWIIEALEEFDEEVDGEKVTVKVGEQRIVPLDTVHKQKYLSPPVKEHVYELKMEKKLKRLIADEEKKHGEKE